MNNFTIDVFGEMKIAFLKGVVETNHGSEWRNVPERGYGYVHWSVDGFSVRARAHRVSWMLANGPIPEGYVIDHDPSCPKSCVTPSHLQALSPSDHIKLGWARGELHSIRAIPEPGQFEWSKEIECPRCAYVFIPNNAKQKYCSDECMRSVKEDRRSKTRHPKQQPRKCSWCLITFQPKRSDTNFCSRDCIEADQYSKRKVRGKFLKVCLNPECKKEFFHNLERVQCCSKSCATSLRHQERRGAA